MMIDLLLSFYCDLGSREILNQRQITAEQNTHPAISLFLSVLEHRNSLINHLSKRLTCDEKMLRQTTSVSDVQSKFVP